MAWIDACAHAVLSAQTLLKMHKIIVDSGESGKEWNLSLNDLQEEVDRLGKVINQAMWDDEVGFYHDLRQLLHFDIAKRIIWLTGPDSQVKQFNWARKQIGHQRENNRRLLDTLGWNCSKP